MDRKFGRRSGIDQVRLAPLEELGAETIVSATLSFYTYQFSYSYGKHGLYQLGMDWKLGTTGAEQNYENPADGAWHRCRHGFEKIEEDAWDLYDEDTKTYVTELGEDLALDPVSPAAHRFLVRFSIGFKTLRWYEVQTASDGKPTAYSTLEELMETDPSTFPRSRAYYWDQVAKKLYVRKKAGSAIADMRLWYVPLSDTWDWNTRLADNYWYVTDGRGQNEVDVWDDFDITEMVKRWLGLEDREPTPNYGFQFDRERGTSGGGTYYRGVGYLDDPSLRTKRSLYWWFSTPARQKPGRLSSSVRPGLYG